MDAWALRLTPQGDRRDRRGPLQRGDRPDRDAARPVRGRRASAPRHQHGEAGRAQAAAPGNRRLLDHRRQRLRRQRRCRRADHRQRPARAARAGHRRSWASVGVDPAITGLAPVEAIPKALARAGLSISDVDLFEINEAFASMCVATVKLLDIDPDKRQRQRQRLLARPSGGRHRRPDARHAGARTAPTRRRHRRRRDVRGRRNGFGDGHRGSRLRNCAMMTR